MAWFEKKFDLPEGFVTQVDTDVWIVAYMHAVGADEKRCVREIAPNGCNLACSYCHYRKDLDPGYLACWEKAKAVDVGVVETAPQTPQIEYKGE